MNFMWLLTKQQTKKFWIVLSILLIAIIIYEIIRFNIPDVWSNIYALSISAFALLGILWIWKKQETSKTIWIVVISVWILFTLFLCLETFNVF